MKRLNLVNKYIDLLKSRLHDDLGKILSKDFYFRNPLIEIFGGQNFIDYANANYSQINTEHIELKQVSDFEFAHEYYVVIEDDKPLMANRIHVIDYIKISNGQIVSTVADYKTDHLELASQQSIAATIERYGVKLSQSHLQLVKHFMGIFDTQQLDDLHDLLTDDFYFKNPKVEISGKEKYIKYSKNKGDVFNTDTISLTAQSPTKYVHEYILTLFDPVKKSKDSVRVKELINIKNDLIASSVVDYLHDVIPPLNTQSAM